MEKWNEGEFKQVECKKEAYYPKSLWRTCYTFAIRDPSENMIPSYYNYSLEVSFNIFKQCVELLELILWLSFL